MLNLLISIATIAPKLTEVINNSICNPPLLDVIKMTLITL